VDRREVEDAARLGGGVVIVRHLRQTRRHNCGQTVVAMATGASIEEIEALMGGHGHTKMGTTRPIDLKRALDHFRLELGKRNRCKGAISVDTALLTIRLRPFPGRFHWALWHDGKYYDSCAQRALTPPEFGVLLAAEKARVTSWMEIRSHRFAGRFSRRNKS